MSTVAKEHIITTPPYTASDYVQDGLLIQYDGIENAGYDSHVEGNVIPKPLKGDITFSTASAQYVTLTKNTIQIAQDSYHTCMKDYREERFDVGQALAKGQLTFESRFAVHGDGVDRWRGVIESKGFFIRGYCGSPTCQTYSLFFDDQTITLSLEVWYHMAIVCDNQVATLYIDNKLVGVYQCTLAPSWLYLFGVGYGGNGLETNFYRIYDRPLSQAELKKNYNIDRERFDL